MESITMLTILIGLAISAGISKRIRLFLKLNRAGGIMIIGLVLLLPACTSMPRSEATAESNSSSSQTNDNRSPVSDIVGTPTAVAITTPVGEDSSSAVEDISQSVAERTPVPTPTLSPIGEIVEEIASEPQLAGKTLLGLGVDDWINLGLSVLFAIMSYVLVVWLLFGLLNWVVHRTQTQFDDQLLTAVGPTLKWLVVVWLTRFAFLRLDFLSDWQRTLLGDLFFIVGLGILYYIVLQLIQFAVKWYRNNLEPEEDKKRFEPMIVMAKRLSYVFVSIIFLSFALSHFGINITVLSAAIFFVALVIAIGAKAAVTDAISGFIILIDQPFRIGDAIYIKELDTRGDVLEIGSRTTRIRTNDNREVIVPNSQIGESQVVNYNYPDPSYRVQTDIGLAYGIGDMEQIHQVIEETVRGVEGVLPDKPVEVFFLAFGDSARQLRLRWWIGNILHEELILDRVNIKLEKAFKVAGIMVPFTTYDLNVMMKGGNPPSSSPMIDKEQDHNEA